MWPHGPDWSGRLLNNWQAAGIFTAQSGSPFTVVLGGAPAASAAAFGNPARPNLVSDPYTPGPVAANPNCQYTPPTQVRVPQRWFNPCAFVIPPSGLFPGTVEFGNEGRNILTGPGFTDLDFGLSKSIAFRSENHKLMFRGDFFNLFNHPNFDIPAHVLGGGEFSQLTSSNAYGSKPPRQIQLSARYVF
jgi:hypothetical protein